MTDEGGDKNGDADAESFYVAVRVLEEVAKSEGNTEGAAVCARVAERVADGDKAADALNAVAGDSGNVETAGRLRAAFKEVHEHGRADIVEEVDDAVVAHLRSEFDG